MENNRRLVALKITLLVVYLLTTAILLWIYLETVKEINNGNGFSIVLAVLGMIYGGLIYFICTIMGISGLAISVKRKYGKLNVVLFVVGIILPILTELSFVLWAFLY